MTLFAPKMMDLILVVFISTGMVENSQNGDSRSLKEKERERLCGVHTACKY